MLERARWFIAAVILLWSSVVSAQVFQSQGPGLRIGPINTMQSADAPPNGTAGGAIQAILPDPVLGANTMFATSVNGGVFRTTDGGTTWTPLTDKQASLSIASLGLDPTDATGRTIIAGAGITSNGNWLSSGALQGRGGERTGLLYTTDGGARWSSLGASALAGQSVIGVATRGSTILAATFEVQDTTITQTSSGALYGLYRSVTGGTSFSRVAALPGPVTSLVADPTNPARFYAAVTSVATPNQTSVYVTPNAGATWTQVFTQANSNGTISDTQQTVLTLATGPNGSVAVAVSNMQTTPRPTLSGVFLSQNSGGTWHQLNAPPSNQVVPGGQTPVNLTLAIDPNNANIVYLAGDRNDNSPFFAPVFRLQFNPANDTSTSTSLIIEGTGPNFSNANAAHADSRAIAFDSSGRLIFASDGGLYVRNNPQGGGSWQGLNNFAAFESYKVAFDANSKRLVVAAQDNGVSLQSLPGRNLYSPIGAGDGLNAEINDRTFAGQSAIYTSSQSLGSLSRMIVDSQGKPVSPFTTFSDGSTNPGVIITCNGEQTCSTVVGATDAMGNDVNFSSPFVLNRVSPTRIAMGGTGAYVTEDTYPSNATTIDLTLVHVGDVGGNVTSIAYGARDNANALVVGALGPDLLWRSLTAAEGTLEPLPAYANAGGGAPTGIVFDARTAQRFFVADGINLWSTRNGTVPAASVTFQSLTPNLPLGFTRPTSLEFIANNGVNALLVGGLNLPLACGSSPDGCVINTQQSPITVADSDSSGNLSGWRAFGQGLPNALISTLSYNPTVDVLAAGAVGRGVFVLYDVTSNFPQATVLQFGLADNNSNPDASILTNGTAFDGTHFVRPLNKYGTGTLTIAGNATYTGGTTILGGVLQLGIGGAGGSIIGNVAFCSDATNALCDPSTNKALVFNRSDTYTFDGAISGPGQVVQFGTGTTVLTAVSTYSGPTSVLGGTLRVNGSIASSPVFVNSGGTLGGNGTVGPTTVLPGATLSPGNSVGTLTVNGNLIFSAASLYLVEVQGNAADRTNATGTAALAGTVGVVNLGSTVARSYTILSAAGGRTGTFDALAAFNLPAFITASLAYTPTDALLNFSSGIGSIAGLTRNQSAVAAALDSSFNSGAGTLPALFGVPASQLPAAMDALSGEGISGTQETAFFASDMFTSIMMDQGAFWRGGESLDVNGVAFGAEPLQYAPSKKSKASEHPAFKAIGAPAPYQPRWRAWLTGFDGTAKLDGEAGIGSASLSHNTGGLAGGLDYQFAPDVLAGLAIGGSSSDFAVRDRITSGHLEAAHFGAYGVKTWGSLYAAGALSFSTFWNRTNRTIAGVGATEMATASFGSNLFSGRLELGSKHVFGAFTVTPFAAVQFAQLWQDGFTETNPVPPGAPGPLGLSYGSVSVSSLPTFLGAQFDTRIPFANGMVLSPNARLSWVHEFNPNRTVNPAFIALPGAAFTVDGPRAASDAARIDAGAKLAIRSNAWLFASFDSEFSDRSQSYAGKGGLRVAW